MNIGGLDAYSKLRDGSGHHSEDTTEALPYLAPIAVLKACFAGVEECTDVTEVPFPAVAAFARLANSAILARKEGSIRPSLSPERSTTHISAKHVNDVAFSCWKNFEG